MPRGRKSIDISKDQLEEVSDTSSSSREAAQRLGISLAVYYARCKGLGVEPAWTRQPKVVKVSKDTPREERQRVYQREYKRLRRQDPLFKEYERESERRRMIKKTADISRDRLEKVSDTSSSSREAAERLGISLSVYYARCRDLGVEPAWTRQPKVVKVSKDTPREERERTYQREYKRLRRQDPLFKEKEKEREHRRMQEKGPVT